MKDWKAANANTYHPHADVPMPGGAPPFTSKKDKRAPVPRQISQHQRLFGDTYPQVTPTNLFAESRTLHQADMQSTDSMEMARYAGFANLNLGGMPRNQYILDRTRPGVVANMYPDTTGPGVTPSTPIVQEGEWIQYH